MYTLRFGMAVTFVTAAACSDAQESPCPSGYEIHGGVCELVVGDDLDAAQHHADAAMDGSSTDAGDSDVGGDASVSDIGNQDAGLDAMSADMADDAGEGLDSGSDTGVDIGMDSGADTGADSGTDAGTMPGVYDTTGWTMKTFTKNESASVGTPDSYFFNVDPGSPLSAFITGGGNGTWSVNVYGGYSNQLYPCSGSPLCQVMLRPEDTTVIVTAITTDIGGYSLTLHYAGAGLQ
jgi:hypothetical protein